MFAKYFKEHKRRFFARNYMWHKEIFLQEILSGPDKSLARYAKGRKAKSFSRDCKWWQVDSSPIYKSVKLINKI